MVWIGILALLALAWFHYRRTEPHSLSLATPAEVPDDSSRTPTSAARQEGSVSDDPVTPLPETPQEERGPEPLRVAAVCWTGADGVWGFNEVASAEALPSASPCGDLSPDSGSNKAPAENLAAAETRADDVEIDQLDFTAEETWRLLHWCEAQGADQFAVDLHPTWRAPVWDPFEAFANGRALRERLIMPSPRETMLYRLEAGSIEALRLSFPSGLFHGPSYGFDEPWAEDPIVYRAGHLMLGIISHEGFGVLRISRREQEILATIGQRAAFFSGNREPLRDVSFGPVRFAILGHEFPCLSGGPEDHWLRVHFRIESVRGVFVGYRTLNITIGTLDAWRHRLTDLATGRSMDATLRSERVAFTLTMLRSCQDSSIQVVVDGRGMGSNLFGHVWKFAIEHADLQAVIRQCDVVVREHEASLRVRPRAAMADDPERALKAGRRFLLTVG